MPATVTLKDVAQEAGIHASAVSRVLRGKDGQLRLSDRRRQEIRDAADRLGYRPNAAARATVSGRFNSIALVCGTGVQTSTLHQGLLYPLTDALGRRDMQLIVTRLSDEKLTDETQLPLFLRKHACDGLLLNYTHHVPPGVRQIIARYRIPSVWFNVKQDADCVHPDDFEAGRAATRWLLQRGHTRVGYLNFSYAVIGGEDHYSVADRRAGYAAAMVDAGLVPDVVDLGRGLTDAQRLTAVRELLQREDRPTAMTGYGGEVDAAAVAALTLGLDVPRDLDLVRFGEVEARFGGITIPTFLTPQRDLAAAAVDAVLRKARKPATPLEPIAVGFDPPELDPARPDSSAARRGDP